MNETSILAQLLDRLHFTRNRNRPDPSATGPMSDRELAVAIRELKRRAAAERAERMRASTEEKLRQIQHSLNEEETYVAAQGELTGKAIKLLPDPLPDTFLGRKTQKPFSSEDKE